MGVQTSKPVPFDEWRPDVAPLVTGMVAALNVLPVPDGYAPMPMPAAQGPAGLAGAAQLLYAAVTPDGVAVPLVFAPSAIYRATATAWLDISRPGGYGSGEPWNAVRWADLMVAVNGVDPLQYYQIGTTGFADIADAPGGLTAVYLAIVGDFIVAADMRDSGGANRYPSRVQWSGWQHPLNWSVNRALQAAYVDRPNIGRIRGLTGGEYGLIHGENGLDRMDYTGPPNIWQFSNLEVDIGCEVPRSVVQAGNMVFWYSKRGWRMSTGGPSTAIGHGKVDEWTRNNIDPDKIHLMSAVPLYHEQAILWAFVSRDSPTGFPDRVLAYSWSENKWTPGQMAVQILGRATSPDIFTDDDNPPGLPLLTDDSDLMTDSFAGDSSVYPAAVLDGGQLALIQQQPGTVCQLTTAEQAIIPGRSARVTRLQPLVDGVPEALWGYVETRDDQRFSSTTRGGPYEPEDSDGSLSVNDTGKFHRFTLDLRTPFNKALGIQIIEVTDTGRR
jgi:hypothetical protein